MIKETKVLDNKTITNATTGDSNMVYCHGAKSVSFVFTSSAAEVFAAANAFQVLVRTRLGESILAPATPSKVGVRVVNATDLNGAAANAGIVITVTPSDAQNPNMAIWEIGCRVTSGAVSMTDVDCYAEVNF